jgi:hypothetical protein
MDRKEEPCSCEAGVHEYVKKIGAYLAIEYSKDIIWQCESQM